MKTLKIFYKVLFAASIAMTVSACERDNPDPGGTATQKMAAEWWVRLPDDPDSWYHIGTYNTSANSPTEMWLDDFQTFWAMKGKITVDQKALTFSGSDIQNDYYPITFNITNGKILKGVSKGPVSKAVTDSIYFEAEFSDDPGTIYTLSGYRRTRYAEDDH